MKILVIEDNPIKRSKIIAHLVSAGEVQVDEAASFNSGMVSALNSEYDFLLLDMSMPTFDRTGQSNGGRFRPMAGRDIALRLARAGRLPPFYVVTGYRDFGVGSQSMTIDDIDSSLRGLGERYLGYVYFDVANSGWKDGINSALKGIFR